MYVCMYVCVYVNTHTHTHTHKNTHTHTHTYIRTEHTCVGERDTQWCVLGPWPYSSSAFAHHRYRRGGMPVHRPGLLRRGLREIVVYWYSFSNHRTVCIHYGFSLVGIHMQNLQENTFSLRISLFATRIQSAHTEQITVHTSVGSCTAVLWKDSVQYRVPRGSSPHNSRDSDQFATHHGMVLLCFICTDVRVVWGTYY